ncbi:hypothetical protein [Nonomuraea sp. NPDC049141]|uniref:hypothetical protein n=1 Tax=unclassified Nonomuraea TaxID=2593643 RepID=UPI0033CE46CC
MTESSRSAQTAQRGMLRPVLWVLLLISAVLNIVTSNINIFVGIGFGLATLACAAGLVVDHYRHRRP